MRVIHSLAAAASLAALALGAAAPAQAQAGATPVVVIDSTRIVGESLAGKDAQAKLQAIATGVQKELEPESTALQAEQKALGPSFEGKSEEQIAAALRADKNLSTKYNSFIQRTEAFRQKSQLRAQELEVTRRQTISDVLTAADPDVASAMQAKGAQVVLERQAVITVGPNADVTTDVINRFNNRVKTINVAKVDLTKQQQ